MIDPLANISGIFNGLLEVILATIGVFLQPFNVLVVSPLLQIVSLFTTGA